MPPPGQSLFPKTRRALKAGELPDDVAKELQYGIPALETLLRNNLTTIIRTTDNPHLVNLAARSEVRENVCAALASPLLSPELAIEFGASENPHHRGIIAGNPITPEPTLRQLANDKKESVRASIAHRKDCPADVLLQLAGDTSPDVQNAIASNLLSYHPNNEAEVTQALSSSIDPRHTFWRETEGGDMLGDTADYDPLESILKLPDLTQEFLKKVLEVRPRMNLAILHPNMSAKTLEELG